MKFNLTVDLRFLECGDLLEILIKVTQQGVVTNKTGLSTLIDTTVIRPASQSFWISHPDDAISPYNAIEI